MNTMTKTAKHDGKAISRAEFNALNRRIEDMEDRLELLQAQARGPSPDALPGELVRRLTAGESPVRIWREFRGMTIDRLSAVADVSRSYLSEVENRKKPGSAKFLAACAKALNVSIDTLLGD